jgi:phosphoenolpyruvate carboxykinase (ATP)
VTETYVGRLNEILQRKSTLLDLSAARLVEYAITRGEGQLSANGALAVQTGKYTGRSPQDKFIVRDHITDGAVAWGSVNVPMPEEVFAKLYRRVLDYLAERDQLFVFRGFVGADPVHAMRIQVVNEYAWQNLFARQLFIRPIKESLQGFSPEFTVIAVPGLKVDPAEMGTNSEAFIVISFAERVVLIGGTGYAGEMKKSIFSIMNFLLPQKGVLSMHCSANVGPQGDSALFFGLSGTGKTTLSTDPDRRLIGDDEHGWSEAGIFNFEGGCYAKCINLSQEFEPQIWDAIRFGSVMENVVIDPETRVPDYSDGSLTENTRVAYPLEHIQGRVPESRAGHPRAVVFLTADAFGVLPPVSILNDNQIIYHFLSGYTSKLAGTERGIKEPQATFSACFGEPFLPLPPKTYGEMLRDLVNKHGAKVYLVNTGWSGGPYGVGKRISIAYTRAIVKAALAGDLVKVELRVDPIFGLQVPTACPGVPAEILDPKSTWADQAAYESKARELAKAFQENFSRYGSLGEELLNGGLQV